MGHDLAKLLLEVCGVLGLIGGTVLALRRRVGQAITVLPVAAGLLAVLAVAFAIANVHGAASAFNQARRHAVASSVGLERCLTERNGEAGPQLPARRRFINWIKSQLPKHAIYMLAPYAGPPDIWCVALVLLPSLPAVRSEHARWTIAFGTIPTELEARIARRDPTVRVFAPGFALAREGTR